MKLLSLTTILLVIYHLQAVCAQQQLQDTVNGLTSSLTSGLTNGLFSGLRNTLAPGQPDGSGSGSGSASLQQQQQQMQPPMNPYQQQMIPYGGQFGQYGQMPPPPPPHMGGPMGHWGPPPPPHHLLLMYQHMMNQYQQQQQQQYGGFPDYQTGENMNYVCGPNQNCGRMTPNYPGYNQNSNSGFTPNSPSNQLASPSNNMRPQGGLVNRSG